MGLPGSRWEALGRGRPTPATEGTVRQRENTGEGLRQERKDQAVLFNSVAFSKKNSLR